MKMKTKGFTLIEMMLSVALLGILGGVSVPLYQSFQNQNQLSIATNTTAQTIRRAQILSRANDGDAQWGVYIQMGSVTLFQGDDFDDRDPAFDERTDIATTLSISGQQ
jgi:prepilin-type N-terminal cleavage/methylation domain-containing protein